MTTPLTLFAYKKLNTNSKSRSEGIQKTPFEKKSSFRRIIGIIILGIIIAGIAVTAIWMEINVFKDLPDVSTVKDMPLSKAIIIQDRNGIEIYKFFDENRE